MLDRQTYPDRRVVNLAQKMIAVRINVGQDSAIAEKFQVEGTPTIVFLNSKGKKVHEFVGFRPPEEFVKEMKEAIKKAK